MKGSGMLIYVRDEGIVKSGIIREYCLIKRCILEDKVCEEDV